MDVLGTMGSLPKKIGDVTTSISTGAVSLDTMVGKMDAAIKGVPTYNPVSGAIVGGLSKTTGALKKGTSAISNAGKKIQTVGAGAVNQAIKAISIARGFVAPLGMNLICTPAFYDVIIDGKEKTAIRLIVEAR